MSGEPLAHALALGVALALAGCGGGGGSGGDGGEPPNDEPTVPTADTGGTTDPRELIDVAGTDTGGETGTGTGGGTGTDTGGETGTGTDGGTGDDTGGETGTGTDGGTGGDTGGETGTGTGGTTGDDTGGGTGGTSDPDGDDRPGLVVEGLGDRGPDAVSPWLLDTTFFRRDPAVAGTGEAFAYLLRYPDDFPVGRHVDFWTKELDTCELTRPVDPPSEGGDEGGGDGEGPPPYIGGGDSITVNTPSGPWLVIDAEPIPDEEGELFYTTGDGGLPGALPADATLSVPGGDFPTVAAFPLPDEPPPPVGLTPADDEVLGLDTVYTWEPRNGSDHILLDFIALDAESGEFIDFPLVCQVVDDGDFRLPDEARTFLATTSDDVVLRYARVRDTLTLTDEGIVVRTRVIVAE